MYTCMHECIYTYMGKENKKQPYSICVFEVVQFTDAYSFLSVCPTFKNNRYCLG